MKKKMAFLSLTIVFTLLCFGAVMAEGEKATKEECVAKCKEVAAIAQEKGLDAAIEAVMAPGSPFVWKDSYVYILDMNGTVLAHPISTKLKGQSAMGFKDANGKLFIAESINLTKDKNEGWVDYMWMVPDTKEIKPKQTYLYKIPGKEALALAGVYVY